MKKIKSYVSQGDFSPEAIGGVSRAAGALCTWVHAIYIYANVAKEVAPKRAALKSAQDSLSCIEAVSKVHVCVCHLPVLSHVARLA